MRKRRTRVALPSKLTLCEEIYRERLESGALAGYPDLARAWLEKVEPRLFAKYCLDLKAWFMEIRLRPENSQVQWSDDRQKFWFVKEKVAEASGFIEYTISWCHENLTETRKLAADEMRVRAIYLTVERNHVEFLLGEHNMNRQIKEAADRSDIDREKFLREHFFAVRTERSFSKMSELNSEILALLEG